MAKTKTPKSDVYVYSTLSNDNIYRSYKRGGGDMPVPDGEGIFIKGGANLADFTGLVTPRGVVTGVTNEEAALLKANDMFKLHMANGFITLSDTLEDADDVADADMAAADKAAPLTAEALAPDDPSPAGAPIVAETAPKPAASPRKA